MGSSLYTNSSAMTALQNLRSVEKRLNSTQVRISTGYRINEAADNTAYWSIVNTMRSDRSAFAVIKDVMQLGKNAVDQSYVASTQIRKELVDIKDLVFSLHGLEKAAQDKVKDTIVGKLETIKMAVESNDLNGHNDFIGEPGKKTDAPTSQASYREIVASFKRRGTDIQFSTIKVNLDEMRIATRNEKNEISYTAGVLKGIFADDFMKKETPAGTEKDSSGAWVASDHADIKRMADVVESCLATMNRIDRVLGAAKTQVDSQTDFVSKMIDNMDRSVGALVDADMNAESARLAALQVQQQLAVQSLSIANQSTQTIMALFR